MTARRLNVSREALNARRWSSRNQAPAPTPRSTPCAGLLRRPANGGRRVAASASDLVDEALESADLNDFVKTLIRALPDSLINAAVKTDDVLTRTINDLDLLANLDDQDDLNRPQPRQVEAAVTQAVKDSLAARLRDLL